MVSYNFDTVIDRRNTYSSKWDTIGGKSLPEDVLPLSLADMDFKSPPEVIEALSKRVEHGVFGYSFDHDGLKEIVCERMRKLYQWEVHPSEVLFSPGVISGMASITRAVSNVGDGILMQTPVFGPFFRIAEYNQRTVQALDLDYVQDDSSIFHYEIDFDAFEAAAANPKTSLFYLCNPHNPCGFVFSREDLERIVDICMKHNVVICSDDIHGELLLDDIPHIPAASLAPEISQNTVTLISPSKTFNLAGLSCSVIIAQNKNLHEKIHYALRSMDMLVNTLGFTAAITAYQQGDSWLSALRTYLKNNRDFALDYIQEHMSGIKTTIPNATYLLWMDCREFSLPNGAQDYFLNNAKVALEDGSAFGESGKGFVRLNFGCPGRILAEALEHMRDSL